MKIIIKFFEVTTSILVIFLFVLSISNWLSVTSKSDWKTTSANITSLDFREYNDGQFLDNSDVKNGMLFNLVYQYTVDGVQFNNDQKHIFLLRPSGLEYVDVTIIKAHRDGKPIEIKYNPDNPAESAIFCGRYDGMIWDTIIPSILVLGLILHLRQKRKQT